MNKGFDYDRAMDQTWPSALAWSKSATPKEKEKQKTYKILNQG